LVTVQQGSPGIPFQGCVQEIVFRNCFDQTVYLTGSDLGYTTSYIPETRFTICACEKPTFTLAPNCEDAACVVKLSEDCTNRVCFTWEVFVPQNGSITNLSIVKCNEIIRSQYSDPTSPNPTTLFQGTYFICSLEVPTIITGTVAAFVKTQPTLTQNCADPIPNLPVPVGSCLEWQFTNLLNPGETVTFIYTNCDRGNFVMTVDDQFDADNFTICAYYTPIFISGSPTNDVFSRLLVFQSTINQCGCYYGCSSGVECLPLVRYLSEISGQEVWNIPVCGGSNVPQVGATVIGSPIPPNYAGVAYSACTVNPFQWWAWYSVVVNAPCTNLDYPLIVPNLQNPISVYGGWKGMSQDDIPGTTVFDLTTLGNNVPRLIANSCGCNDVGFSEEVCVVLRDCCTDNIIYTGTILNTNYIWVSLNYTVDNLGLTDCCLYFDEFVQPVVSPSEYGLYNHNYTYPNNRNGYIDRYQYTGCTVCNPPLPSLTPTTTTTPTPTPLPIYRWLFTNTSPLPQNYFSCAQNSCFIQNISVSRYSTNGGDLFNFLNNLGNNVIIEIFDSFSSRSRSFTITNTSISLNQAVFNFTLTTRSNCTNLHNLNNWNFISNQFYSIKFNKR